MITKNDPTKNTNLFKAAEKLLTSEAAQELLEERGRAFLYPPDDFAIHNINDYFACLKDLAFLEETLPNREKDPVYVDPIFTILPTTEDTLQINANTRDIKIPDNFVKYGVGVQGDEIAEIIYFSIDRFFDAVDLAEREILIQWKHDKAPAEEEYLSAVYKKSLTLQPGKIVFGWPISGEMTTKAGNILFSVRFYEKDKDSQGNDILNYSFGTLTKTIKIQPALDFQIDSETLSNIIDKNNKIYNNLSNSLKVDLNYDVAIPVFTGYFIIVENIVDDEKVFTLDPAHQAKTYNLPVTLAVKAEIPRTVDAGVQMVSSSPLAYEWEHTDKDGKTELCNSSIQYFKVDLTKEKESNPNEKYYIKDDSLEGYSVYSVSQDTNLFDNDVELYTMYSTCTPKGPGHYTVKVTNLYSSGAYKETDSDTWVIPYPKAPEFELINPAPNKTFTIKDGNFIQAIVTSLDDGEVEAQWYYSENSDKEGKPEEDPITSKLSLTTTYTPDKEGYYYLVYSNKKNEAKETKESDMIAAFYQASEIGTITHKVEGKEITNPPVDGNSSIITTPGDMLSVEISDLDYAGTISYVWYEYMSDGEPREVATGMTYRPNESGWYYCTITNVYQGTQSQKNSAYFSVSFPGR